MPVSSTDPVPGAPPEPWQDYEIVYSLAWSGAGTLGYSSTTFRPSVTEITTCVLFRSNSMSICVPGLTV